MIKIKFQLITLGGRFLQQKNKNLLVCPSCRFFTFLLIQPLKLSKINSTTITQFLLLVCVALGFTVQVFLHAGCNLRLAIMLGVLFKILSLFFFFSWITCFLACWLPHVSLHPPLYIVYSFIFLHDYSLIVPLESHYASLFPALIANSYSHSLLRS